MRKTMKIMNAWIALLLFIQVVALSCCTAGTVVLTATQVASNLVLNWGTVVPGSHYELQQGVSVKGPWVPIGGLMTATGTSMTATVAVTAGTKFFRVAEKSLTATFKGLTNGTVITQLTNITLATTSVAAQVQYIGVYDVVEGKTNKLKWIDSINDLRTITLNPALLKTGVKHELYMMVADNFGDQNTGDSLRIVNTEKVEVYPRSLVSLNNFSDTEWMFYLSFSTLLPWTGSWQVEVSDQYYNPVWSWTGLLETSRNVQGEIIVKDENARRYQPYDQTVYGSFFRVKVTVSPIGANPVVVQVNSPIRQRAQNSYVVAEQLGKTTSFGLSRTNMDNAMAVSLQAMTLNADSQLEVNSGAFVFDPNDWNKLDGPQGMVDLQYGLTDYPNRPTRAVLWTDGSPIRIGPLGDGIRVVDIRNGPVMSFVIVCGNNAAFGVVDSLTGISGGDIADVTERGRFPRFGMVFLNQQFGQMNEDMASSLGGFIREFMRKFSETSFTNLGGPAFRYRELLEICFAQYPDMRSKVVVTGYPDVFPDW
jgi:hypothetical protein